MEKNPELKQLIKQLVQEELDSRMEHTCWCCDWLRMCEKPTHMRFCKNPNPMVLDDTGHCKEWVLATDLNKRVKGNFTV